MKLSYSKERNALSRIIYVQDKDMWNVICSNGSFTIDLVVYRTYKYICLYNPKSSSHKNHSVSDVHAGEIVYSQLAMRSRIRIRLGQEAIDLTPKRVSSVSIVNTFPANL